MPANDLGGLIAEEVKRAEADFDSFRTRSVALITTSAALITLLTGLVAIAAGSRKDVLPDSGGVWPAVSIGSFLVAGIVALVIQWPAKLKAANATALATFVQNNWADPGWDESVAAMLVDYLASVRKANVRFGWLFMAALVLVLLGVTAVGILSFDIFLHVS